MKRTYVKTNVFNRIPYPLVSPPLRYANQRYIECLDAPWRPPPSFVTPNGSTWRPHMNNNQQPFPMQPVSRTVALDRLMPRCLGTNGTIRKSKLLAAHRSQPASTPATSTPCTSASSTGASRCGSFVLVSVLPAFTGRETSIAKHLQYIHSITHGSANDLRSKSSPCTPTNS